MFSFPTPLVDHFADGIFSGETSSSIELTGTYYIDSLIERFSWTGQSGSQASVYYNLTSAPSGARLLSGNEITAAYEAIANFESVANINFIESAFGAEILIGVKNLTGGEDGLAITSYSGSKILSSQVFMDNSITGYEAGGYAYSVMIHEIAHALGLKHPSNYSGEETPPFLPSSEDSVETTVMSYNDNGTYPSSLMIYDIAALQYLYGANSSYNSGNNNYNLSSFNSFSTIWDGGGSDTITGGNTTTGAVIDLREGINFYSQLGAKKVWNAFSSSIENIVGTEGSDTLNGNDINNIITGNGGNDIIFGFDGSDSINGNAGNDSVNGNTGADTIFGGQGSDSVLGGKDNDYVNGNNDNDTVNGNNGNDTVYGGKNDDLVYGGRDDDLVYGNLGNDTISGDLGDDTLSGNEGSDTFVFGVTSGVDIITDFDPTVDTIQLTSGANGNSITSSTAALAAVTFTLTDAVLNLGGGNIVYLTGVTSGSLTTADFIVV